MVQAFPRHALLRLRERQARPRAAMPRPEFAVARGLGEG
jgi:hypothetical protein